MHELITTILNLSQALGYPGIIILMTIESSFIPFPSEVVIPPAAYLASQGIMNVYLVAICGVAGSLIGSSINYILARWLGRKVVYNLADSKFFRLMLLNKKKIAAAERFFLKYGRSSTFIGRLVPAVRQLISLPAGFAEMKYRDFILFTFLGSGLWVIILTWLGYAFGANQSLFANYYKQISWFFVFVFIVFVGIVWYRNKKYPK